MKPQKSIRTNLIMTAFFIGIFFLPRVIFAQNTWPPPPPSDANWSGFTASINGPLPDDGPLASA